MANEHLNIKILQTSVVDAECKIPWADRFRLLFGCTLYVTTLVHLPRRCHIKTQTKYSIQRFFGNRPALPSMDVAENDGT